MGNNEEGKSSKSDKSSSPSPPDQTNIHVYPDWAAMQAYYGPRVPLPPYYNSAMAPGHAPHPYMWGPPQAMMPPYGSPYAAIYSHGGMYPHTAVPIAATPAIIETPAKSSGNSDRGLMKKLKGFDGLAMSIGNGNADNAEDRADHGLSQSVQTDGSTDGSDGNTARANQTRRKRSREGTPTNGGNVKTEVQAGAVPPAGEENAASDKVLGVTVAPSSATGKLVRTVTALELKNLPSMSAKTSPTSVPQPCAMLPSEAWMQNERELKRERRKQSNRESARRSRLRKQAEAEELAVKVESLGAENVSLKSEISRLTENSEKLRLENAALMKKLKNARLGQTEELILNKVEVKRAQPVSTENLLSRVNNSGSVDRSPDEEVDVYENNSNSGTKLHQLLDTSPRADAVAAG